MNRIVFLLFTLFIILSSCEKKRFVKGDFVYIEFSTDTVHFDTVFTSIGTTTRELRIINPYNEWLSIDNIYLAGDENSPFRLNLDGVPGTEFHNIELPPSDSIFLFVDAIIDPADQSSPLMINDSIVFTISGSIQDVNIIAWGQDINLINGKIIGTGTWSSDKPYVIYNSMMVDTNQVLSVEEGTKILFHRGSTMYIAGRLIINGSIENPVSMATDRIEEAYSDVPGQWQGLYFLNGSTGNMLKNVSVTNAVSAIHAGNLGTEDEPPDLSLKNVFIAHNSVSGLSSIGANIQAENTVIAHCGFYCAFLSCGGYYSFTHCTMANRWDYSNRISPSVYISDYYEYNEMIYSAELVNASFKNSVIAGQLDTEIIIESIQGEDLNVEFVNSAVKDQDGFGYEYVNCILNEDPLFIDWSAYSFIPDTLSPLINSGLEEFAMTVPSDVRGYNRLNDEGPDIGAYERQPGETIEEK